MQIAELTRSQGSNGNKHSQNFSGLVLRVSRAAEGPREKKITSYGSVNTYIMMEYG